MSQFPTFDDSLSSEALDDIVPFHHLQSRDLLRSYARVRCRHEIVGRGAF